MSNNENFKIIAIKVGEMLPTKNTHKNSSLTLDALKNLKSNQIYQFRNEYLFRENDFSEIDYLPKTDVNLYELKTSINNIPININAVVGGNGSGKSTLIELLYWANYNIGSILNLLEDENHKKRKPFKFLDFELLYSVDLNTLINIVFKEGNVYKQSYKQNNNKFVADVSKQEIKGIDDLQQFFYTIVVNYSHYALNSLEIGDWINPLFHKNDGYQTPIVLNPMRTNGDIDINKEKYLLTRRLLANLLEPVAAGQEEKSLRNIANDKIASALELSYNPNPNATLEEPIDSTVREKLIEAFQQYFEFQVTEEQLNDDLFVNVTLSYIHKKLIKMAFSDYKTFKRYREGTKVRGIKYINAYIKRIKESDSHAVFKVKGAILYLKYYQTLLPNLDFKKSFRIEIDGLSQKIQEIQKKESFMVNTFMMSPPSYFYINIVPKDGSSFGSLSSGEKQKIHSVSSIVYHLINLNSVEQLKEEKAEESEKIIHYNYINIILDEIELYYHPEWQRTYIADLLDYIGKINPENLKHIRGLNITFLTHSPYILSDIPNAFVLKLHKGKPYEEGNETFGANVHDLLANDFFMQKGFMGEWAKSRIKSVIESLTLKINNKRIELLNSLLKTETDKSKIASINRDIKFLENENSRYTEIEQTQCSAIISIVGEPVLYNSLMELYSQAFPNDETDFIQSQIDKLTKLLSKK
ncbi:AAA family ATPase [Sphingobacterium cavernae]|uniref:AAA family ATPase n=1 Tax=Sphingobacterium cavernae TaxID=2592657 RepID=UPI00122FDB7E|nr:AAA family ATPase [Sphingobacterium cavernae]